VNTIPQKAAELAGLAEFAAYWMPIEGRNLWNMDNEKREPSAKLRALYPRLSEAELLVAEGKLTEYAQFVFRMYQRVASDPDSNRKFPTLTEQQTEFTIDLERSKNINSPNT
jgi:hypothetical protein